MSKTHSHEHFISATIKTKKCHKTIEFRFEIIVLVFYRFIFISVFVNTEKHCCALDDLLNIFKYICVYVFMIN